LLDRLKRWKATGSSASGKRQAVVVRLERHSAVIARDLPGIYAFIAADDPVAAERVLDAVELTFERLQQQPKCGVPYKAVDAKLVEYCR
jgi:hypothetical protein